MQNLFWIAAFLLTACEVGSGIAPDGSGGGGDDCEPLSANKPDGFHRPGESCMDSGCHGTSPANGAPQFTAAGTIFTDNTGATAKPGATVFVGTVKMISADNGNFYTTEAITFPTTTTSSLCPDNNTMTTPIADAADANCNSCHKIGGAIEPVY